MEWICGNGIAEIGNFYNIFTTNFKWQVVIVGLKKYSQC